MQRNLLCAARENFVTFYVVVYKRYLSLLSHAIQKGTFYARAARKFWNLLCYSMQNTPFLVRAAREKYETLSHALHTCD